MDELMFLAFDCVQDCGGADILRILKFVFKLIDLVLFIVPIGLIVMIMLDFAKNVIAAKEDEMKKNASIVVKRLIYCVVIFLVPTIVNFAVGLVSGTGDNIAAKASYCIDYAKNGDLSVCEVDYDKLESSDSVKNQCYLCVESGVGKREYFYTWGGYNTNNSCGPINDISSENECIDKNDTIEYCYYCDNTKDYRYGTEPAEACSSSWKIDYSKNKESCKSNGSVVQSQSYCYVCADAYNRISAVEWSITKPTSPCLTANGWQIDYSIHKDYLCNKNLIK